MTKKLFQQVFPLVKIQSGPLTIDSAMWKSEIIWALKSVCSGYNNNSSLDIKKVFSKSFPDSKIAQNIQLGPDKVKYICNFGIAPYFKHLLKETLKSQICTSFVLYMICFKVLTLKDPSISESCIGIKIDVDFYFHISLWRLKRFSHHKER